MFDRFLDWFERHKFGVVGTLMLHTFMLFSMAISKLPKENEAKAEQEMVMELAAPEDLPPDPMLEPPLSAPVEVKNLTSNITALVQPQMHMYPGQQAQEEMASDVEAEVLAFEAEEFRKRDSARKAQGKVVVMPELDPSKWDPAQYMPKKNEPSRVEGLTTVTYDLTGRTDIALDVPAYLCMGQGAVVIKVAVERDGRVSRVELDEGRTRADDCMRENALRSAQSARFNSSGTAADPQRGTMTYIFLAQ
jgi:outer membrane biosynthesis protein TonB